jgi:hypothetical protein
MGAYIIHVSIRSVRVFNKGHRLSRIDAAQGAPAVAITLGF